MRACILLIFVLLLFASSASAWNGKTHESLVENIYYSMPVQLQGQLNLTAMKYGATAPDLVFHDTVRHHYPPSQEFAYSYLSNITSISDFSYNFGVASHYISDSFVAPHYVSGENYTLHSKFENQLNDYAVQAKCIDYGYSIEDLHIGAENGNDWQLWINNNYNKSIPEKELEQSQQFLYSIAQKMLNYSCAQNYLGYSEKSLFNAEDIGYLAILIFLIILILLKLFKHKLSS